MERLETIVRQLEQGNAPLEESLKLFQERFGGKSKVFFILHKTAAVRGWLYIIFFTYMYIYKFYA